MKDKGIQINSKVYMLAMALLFGLLLLKINAVAEHTVVDNQCANGSKDACRVAQRWGYEYKPNPYQIGTTEFNRYHCEVDMGCRWYPNPGGNGGMCLCG